MRSHERVQHGSGGSARSRMQEIEESLESLDRHQHGDVPSALQKTIQHAQQLLAERLILLEMRGDILDLNVERDCHALSGVSR
jgi:hypothetical protein